MLEMLIIGMPLSTQLLTKVDLVEYSLRCSKPNADKVFNQNQESEL